MRIHPGIGGVFHLGRMEPHGGADFEERNAHLLEVEHKVDTGQARGRAASRGAVRHGEFFLLGDPAKQGVDYSTRDYSKLYETFNKNYKITA